MTGQDVDNIRLAFGNRQHAPPTGTDQDRRMWSLNWRREILNACDPIMLSGKRQRLTGEQSFEDPHSLLETINARARRIERQSRLLIFAAHPARPQPKFKAPAGEHIQRGYLLTQHNWMAIIVVKDHAANT